MDYDILAGELLSLATDSAYIRVIRELAAAASPEIFFLLYLKRHGGIAYPKELGHAFDVSSARTAVIINRLEKDGYVSRRTDDNDNRYTIVEISETGLELLRAKSEKVTGRLSEMLKHLGADDAREYIRLQRKLADAISGE